MARPLGIVDLVELASSAGAARSGWWRIGDGPWYGTVVDTDGVEYDIEELKTSWRATSSTQAVFVTSSVEKLLKEVLGR
jgi:hypothetical protein